MFILINFLLIVVNSAIKWCILVLGFKFHFLTPSAFPKNCEVLYFGETFKIKALFSDNSELGSTNALRIDIHNNFDHHSHSMEVNECELAPKKEPINPYVLIESFDIPEGKSEYESDLEIKIPSGNESGIYDEGDYHFFISITDKEGWSSNVGYSIKMLHRK